MSHRISHTAGTVHRVNIRERARRTRDILNRDEPRRLRGHLRRLVLARVAEDGHGAGAGDADALVELQPVREGGGRAAGEDDAEDGAVLDGLGAALALV